MRRSEVDEIQADILEAFREIGSLDEEVSFIYKRLMPTIKDSVYREQVTPYYSDLSVYGLISKLTIGFSEDGSMVDVNSKLRKGSAYLVASTFEGLGFSPSVKDKILHNGILFKIVAVSTIIFSNADLLFKLEIHEDEFFFQDEELRERESIYFEPDVTQDVDETNTTGVNDSIFIDTPAIALGGIAPFTVDEDGDMSKFRVMYKTSTLDFTLREKVYTMADMLLLLNTKFRNKGLIAEELEGSIIIKTEAAGSQEVFSISALAPSGLEYVGFLAGTYYGGQALNTTETAYDSEGDKKW